MSVFLTFSTLVEDAVYTAKSFQWLYDSSNGYVYVMTATTIGDPQTYTLVVYNGTDLNELYVQLEFLRTNNLTNQFTFKKHSIEIYPSFNRDFLLVDALNDVVTLV